VDRDDVRKLLEGVRVGTLTPDEVLEHLARAPVEELGHTALDAHRAVRAGVPEVIYGAGKTGPQVVDIARALLARGQSVLATRLDEAKGAFVRDALGPEATWHPVAGVLVARRGPAPNPVGCIGVVSAGTSDAPVAEEARVVAEALGNHVLRIEDVGIAGVHRVLARLADLRACRVVVVVAGMDGALPGLVAGLVRAPVVAVPTSVGYGASFQGLAALLTMLNACAPGVSVVNIDNGFGAAYQASRINRAGEGA
jgi:NCAIR mutase (PurE)-related protein